MVNNQCLRKPVHTVPKSGTETFPKNDDPGRGTASLRYHRSYRWTEALTGIVFVSAHELALKSRFLTLTRVVSYISSRYYHSNRTKYFWEERRSPIKIIYFWVKTEGSANTLLGSLYYRSRARVSTVVCHAYRDFRLLSRGEDRGLLRPPLISPPNL